MRRGRIVATSAALALGALAALSPASAEPTKYCAARIEEAEDTVKALEASLGQVKDAQDKGEIEAWMAQAKQHLATAKAAGAEEECVAKVELAKTLTQDALYLAAQSQ